QPEMLLTGTQRQFGALARADIPKCCDYRNALSGRVGYGGGAHGDCATVALRIDELDLLVANHLPTCERTRERPLVRFVRAAVGMPSPKGRERGHPALTDEGQRKGLIEK